MIAKCDACDDPIRRGYLVLDEDEDSTGHYCSPECKREDPEP